MTRDELRELVGDLFEAIAAKCPSKKPLATLFVGTIREVAESDDTLTLTLAMVQARQPKTKGK